MGCRLVVVGSSRQLRVNVSQREEALEGGGATGEDDPAGLVREREREARVNDTAQGFDRVELQWGEVVEAIQGHRRGVPGGGVATQSVQGARHARLAIGSTHRGKCRLVALERATHPRERLAGYPPCTHGAAKAGGGDTLGLQVRNQLGQLGCGAGAYAGDSPEQVFSSKRTQGPGGLSGTQEHLSQEALEALDTDTKSQSSLGQLTPVVRLVGFGGYDQERVFAMRGMCHDRLQDEAGLACVGGSGD